MDIYSIWQQIILSETKYLIVDEVEPGVVCN